VVPRVTTCAPAPGRQWYGTKSVSPRAGDPEVVPYHFTSVAGVKAVTREAQRRRRHSREHPTAECIEVDSRPTRGVAAVTPDDHPPNRQPPTRTHPVPTGRDDHGRRDRNAKPERDVVASGTTDCRGDSDTLTARVLKSGHRPDSWASSLADRRDRSVRRSGQSPGMCLHADVHVLTASPVPPASKSPLSMGAVEQRTRREKDLT
jgi:hypothetical protein